MEDGDVVAEARAEAGDELRGERDLGHEHDRPARRLARRGDGAQVHLGLAAPGHAVQEEGHRAGVAEGAGDGLDGRGLRAASRRAARRASRFGEQRVAGRGAILDATRPSSASFFTAARAFPQRASSCAVGSAPVARRCASIAAAWPRSAPGLLDARASAATHCTVARADARDSLEEARAPSSSRAVSRSTGGSARRTTSPIGAK